jgi:hypothetical protein
MFIYINVWWLPVRSIFYVMICFLLCSCASAPPPIPDSLRADQISLDRATSLQTTLATVVNGWGNPGRSNAVVTRANELGLGSALHTEWIDWFSIQNNVVIDLPGKSPDLVYVVAHYDKTDVNPIRLVGLLLNGVLDDLMPFMSDGAMDNGTGVAVALELAHAVSQREHQLSYRFLFPGAEEAGLRGTRAHLAGLSAEETKRIRLAINIDTVGVDFAENCVTEDEQSGKAMEAAKRSNVELTLAPPNDLNDSDYAPFRRNGFMYDFLLGLENNYIGGLLPQRSWFGSTFTASVINFSACGMSGSKGTGNLAYPVHGPSDNMTRVDLERLHDQFLIINELLKAEDKRPASTPPAQQAVSSPPSAD